MNYFDMSQLDAHLHFQINIYSIEYITFEFSCLQKQNTCFYILFQACSYTTVLSKQDIMLKSCIYFLQHITRIGLIIL